MSGKFQEGQRNSCTGAICSASSRAPWTRWWTPRWTPWWTPWWTPCWTAWRTPWWTPWCTPWGTPWWTQWTPWANCVDNPCPSSCPSAAQARRVKDICQSQRRTGDPPLLQANVGWHSFSRCRSRRQSPKAGQLQSPKAYLDLPLVLQLWLLTPTPSLKTSSCQDCLEKTLRDCSNSRSSSFLQSLGAYGASSL